ncbi:MAG: RNA-binding domain-containing protein [Nitrososphaerales archaeon]
MRRAPDVSLDIRAECHVYPSEDVEKVIRAVKNVLTNCTPEFTDNKVVTESRNIESLSKIYEQARSRAVLGVLSRVLEDNRIANSTWFYLNKQAAYAGIVSICEEESESPLGPIKITITTNQLQSIINWLVS